MEAINTELNKRLLINSLLEAVMLNFWLPVQCITRKLWLPGIMTPSQCRGVESDSPEGVESIKLPGDALNREPQLSSHAYTPKCPFEDFPQTSSPSRSFFKRENHSKTANLLLEPWYTYMFQVGKISKFLRGMAVLVEKTWGRKSRETIPLMRQSILSIVCIILRYLCEEWVIIGCISVTYLLSSYVDNKDMRSPWVTFRPLMLHFKD